MRIPTASSWRPNLRNALAASAVLALSLSLSALSLPGVLAQEAPAQKSAPAAPAALSLPPSPVEVAEKNGTALRMSLKDLTKLALQNNLDIAIQDTNEEIVNQRIIGAHGPYDGYFSIDASTQRQKTINTSTIDQARSGYFNLRNTATWNLRYNQNIGTGGNFRVQYNSGRSDTNQLISLFNPQYSASTSVTFTQPLRRNFKTDQTRTSIKLANLDMETNDSQFKQKVTDTIWNIQGQYWDLVSAIRDYDIQRESVKLAQISLQNNQKKVEIGTLAPIAVIQSQADLATREVSLISSEERILNVENALRSLISSDRNAEIWSKIIVPTDAPDYKEYPVNLDQAIDAALKNRPELEQIDITLRQSEINYQSNLNSKKWQFDLVGTFGTNSSAGPMSYDSKTGLPQIDDKFVGGITNAYKNLFVGGSYTWSVGFSVQIPTRNRSVESSLAQNRIQQRQTLMKRKQQEQTIQVDIRNAVQRLETYKKQVETTRIGRELAQAQLEGEEKRFEAGLSENFRVLDQQRALAQAQGTELNALISYKKAIMNLQRYMYTLVEANDFEVAKSSSENTPNLK